MRATSACPCAATLAAIVTASTALSWWRWLLMMLALVLLQLLLQVENRWLTADGVGVDDVGVGATQAAVALGGGGL